jgi:hypothetical protein
MYIYDQNKCAKLMRSGGRRWRIGHVYCASNSAMAYLNTENKK